MQQIKNYLQEKKTLVDDFLKNYFKDSFQPQVLYQATTYSLFIGGKRLRPILCMAAYELFGKNSKDILQQACSFELIHTFSLIHDDLPAIDNDDLRRGKTSNHKVFGEAMAILAGDALLVEAFNLMTKNNLICEKLILRAMRELTDAIGIKGLVAGEVMDIISEKQKPDQKTLEFIHYHKTAKFIQSCVKIGGILAGTNEEELSALSDYGKNIGMAFQVIDDILDVTQTSEVLGKPSNSDIEKQKMTYPALFGIEKSKELAKQYIDNALNSVSIFGQKACWLENIANYFLMRRN